MPFGLKTAPSLFQKVMTKIFSPIMENALIYIDDILLFSPDESSHRNLLQRFHHFVQQYKIMLAEKKMTIATKEVDFLGMHLKDGQYVAQPHISQELHNFPDENLMRKQVQQFLSIINYVSEFIPNLVQMTGPLNQLLKKDAPPQWSHKETKVVKSLEAVTQSLPTLQIPSHGNRILQTDASNKCRHLILPGTSWIKCA